MTYGKYWHHSGKDDELWQPMDRALGGQGEASGANNPDPGNLFQPLEFFATRSQELGRIKTVWTFMWITRMSNVVEISQEAGKMLIPPLSRHLNSQASQTRFIPHNFVFWGHLPHRAPCPLDMKGKQLPLHPPRGTQFHPRPGTFTLTLKRRYFII